ncbi:MAG: hypothetical protein AAF558_13425, partial [Verrucomicrobiota bacterium]
VMVSSQGFGENAPVNEMADPNDVAFTHGRFAYVLYDVGGFVNANTFGVPASEVTDAPNYPGVPQYFDLSRLPGINGGLAEALVQWRDAESRVSSYNTYGGYLGFTSWLQKIGYSSSIFTNNYFRAPVGDARFINHRDLQDWFDRQSQTLQVDSQLTVGNIFNTAPSWSPDSLDPADLIDPVPSTNATTADDPEFNYRQQGDWNRSDALSTSFGSVPQLRIPHNRNTLYARYENDQDVRTWEGQIVSVTAGDPILARPFPLHHLELFSLFVKLTYGEPIPVDTPDDRDELSEVQGLIERCFGLVPDSAFPGNPRRWLYRDAFYQRVGASNIDTGFDAYRLFTLDNLARPGASAGDNPQFPTSAREPNFFEILNAGILKGYLGGLTRTHADYWQQAHHVLMIGANIIDQYDEDNLPTIIRLFNGSSAHLETFSLLARGQESLPCVSETNLRLYAPKRVIDVDATVIDNEATGNYRKHIGAWVTFELWDPHQNASARPAGTPQNFRIIGGLGSNTIRMSANIGGTFEITQKDTFPAVYGDTSPYQLRFNIGSVPGGFQDPTFLTEAMLDGATPNCNIVDEDAGPTQANAQLPATTLPAEFVGIFVGFSEEYTSSAPIQPDVNLMTAYYNQDFPTKASAEAFLGASYSNRTQAKWKTNNGATVDANGTQTNVIYFLQYQDARSGDWVTYQEVKLNHRDVGASFNTVAQYEPYPGTRVDHYPIGYSLPKFPNYGHPGTQRVGCEIIDPRETIIRNGPNYGSFGTTSQIEPRKRTISPNLGVVLNPSSGSTSPGAGGQGQQNGAMFAPLASASGQRNPRFHIRTGSSDRRFQNAGARAFNEFGLDTFFTGRDRVLRPYDSDYGFGIMPTINVTANADTVGLGAAFTSKVGPDRLRDRPLILNRAFTSVADLGYVFRGYDWSTLDFRSGKSADAALLDLFSMESVEYENPLSQGKININSAQVDVIEALLEEKMRIEKPGVLGVTSTLSNSSAATIARDLRDYLDQYPLRTNADLVTGFMGNLFDTGEVSSRASGDYPALKHELEAIVRAVSSVSNTRTWNVFLDVIAQTGRFPESASQVDDFIVNSERRYWVNIAIDRFPGEILYQKAWPVYE